MARTRRALRAGRAVFKTGRETETRVILPVGIGQVRPNQRWQVPPHSSCQHGDGAGRQARRQVMGDDQNAFGQLSDFFCAHFRFSFCSSEKAATDRERGERRRAAHRVLHGQQSRVVIKRLHFQRQILRNPSLK